MMIIKIVFPIVLVGFMLSCASTSIMNPPYYRYSIGKIRIENPVLISIDEKNYVCPDSAVYCCENSDWLNRKDVYPYVLTSSQLLDANMSIRFVSKSHYLRKIDNLYFPYNRNPIKKIQSGNVDICIYNFYYGLELFEAYMESTSGEYYDATDPEGINPDADQYNAFRYDTDCYRIVLKAHYSYSQLLKLRRAYKKEKK